MTLPGRQRRTVALLFVAISVSLAASVGGQVPAPVSAQSAGSAASYANAVLADQPVAYWHLGESGGGVANDASGHGQTGSLVGGVTPGVPGPLAGESAMAFDGSSGFIQDQASLSVGADMTLEAWVKVSGAGFGPLVTIDAGDQHTRTLYVEQGRFWGRQDDSSAWPVYSVFGGGVDLTTWHHVVFVSMGTTGLILYVDGVLNGATSVPATPTPFSAKPTIAYSPTSPFLNHFTGSVGEVAIYAKALSAAQVQAHYQASQQAVQPSVSGCGTSLQAQVDAAAPGSTVLVPACVYRETVTVKKPLTLAGQPGAEIRGSDVWSNWTQSGGYWIGPPVPPIPGAEGPCQDGFNLTCYLPEQVFFDGRPLARNPGSQPSSGQFSLDQNRDVVLADNPTGHLVEVSVRSRWLVTGSDHVTIQGFTMRHAVDDALIGAISNDGFSDWAVQDSTFSDAHGPDVSIHDGTNLRVLRNDIGRGGSLGVHGDLVNGGLVQGNHIHDNNAAGFLWWWSGAGLKLTRSTNVTIDSNEVNNNFGHGMWCDTECHAITMSNNKLHDNLVEGILFEIADGASIHDNAIWNSGWGYPNWGWGAGIVISSSANADVFNNVVAWSAEGISVIWQQRNDYGSLQPVGIHVHNNVIARTISSSTDYWADLALGWLNDTSSTVLYNPASNNGGSSNLYWYDQPEGGPVRFSWQYAYQALADFQATGAETGSRYLSNSELAQALGAKGVPVSPPSKAAATAVPASTLQTQAAGAPALRKPAVAPASKPAIVPTVVPAR
ncbi:MAG TPA: LamG-like jellyroll fold domain-containing protein [Chloroflexota bacterium]|jgi:hypothetical protein